MGQVPGSNKPRYLLIGSGRLAHHLAFYFSQLNIHFQTWSRKEAETELRSKIEHASHILLLIKDDAIEKFVADHPQLLTRILIHCSGSLSLKGIYGAHPLMTFGERLYSLPVYQSIPFIVEAREDFADLFPQLANPHYVVAAENKALYHALCSASGNLTVLLWQKAIHEMHQQLNLPPAVLIPYMRQIFFNLADNPDTALTGPLSRRDWQTVERHLKALKDSQLKEVYEAFLKMHLNQLAESELHYGP